MTTGIGTMMRRARGSTMMAAATAMDASHRGARMVRRKAAVAATLVAALVAAACTGGGNPAPPPSPVPAVPSGGTLRVGVCCVAVGQMSLPSFLDPQAPFAVSSGHRALFRCCLLRTLLSYAGRSTADGGTVLHPDLAAELPDVSTDGLTWTFRLKPGIRYGPPLDDVEITTPDVIRALERAATLRIGTEDSVAVFEPIEGVREFADGEASTISGLEAPDPHTLRVHLSEVTSDLGYRFALPATAPIPPSPYDPAARYGTATGHADGYGPFLVPSGPYMIEGSEDLDPALSPELQPAVSGLVPGESLTFVRNPSWSSDALRMAYVDRIEIRVVGWKEAAEQIEAGSLDLLLDASAPPEQVERFEADPELRDRVFRERCNFIGYAAIRLAAPPFDDVHVRRAVNYAFDVEAATRLSSTFRWGSLGVFNFPAADHLAPDSTQSGLLREWDPYTFDLERAREEMAQSRYDADRDGMCDHPACRGVLAIDTNFGPEPQIDRVWRAGFREIGITLEIQRLPFGRFLETMTDPSSPAALTLGPSWEAEYPSPEPLLGSVFGKDGLGASSNTNFSLLGASPEQLAGWGYRVRSVPSVEAKLDECRTRSGVTQQQCWAELDQLLMLEIVPSIPFAGVDEIRIVSERVVVYHPDQPFGALPALDQIALAD